MSLWLPFSLYYLGLFPIGFYSLLFTKSKLYSAIQVTVEITKNSTYALTSELGSLGTWQNSTLKDHTGGLQYMGKAGGRGSEGRWRLEPRVGDCSPLTESQQHRCEDSSPSLQLSASWRGKRRAALGVLVELPQKTSLRGAKWQGSPPFNWSRPAFILFLSLGT